MLIAPIGCGDEESRSARPQRLSAAEQSIVTGAQAGIRSYCRKIGLYLTRGQPLPTPLETQQVNGQVDRLIALAREKPEAEFRNRGTLRSLLGDMIEDLDGANCSDALQRRLAEGRAALPRP